MNTQQEHLQFTDDLKTLLLEANEIIFTYEKNLLTNSDPVQRLGLQNDIKWIKLIIKQGEELYSNLDRTGQISNKKQEKLRDLKEQLRAGRNGVIVQENGFGRFWRRLSDKVEEIKTENPGWHPYGSIGVIATIFSVVSLFAMLFLFSADWDIIVRITIWALLLFILIFNFLIFIKLNQLRYFGQHLSLLIAKQPVLQFAILLLSVGTTFLIIQVGLEAIEIQNTCGKFNNKTVNSIALLNSVEGSQTSENASDVAFVRNILEANELSVYSVSRAEWLNCKSKFEHRIKLVLAETDKEIRYTAELYSSSFASPDKEFPGFSNDKGCVVRLNILIDLTIGIISKLRNFEIKIEKSLNNYQSCEAYKLAVTGSYIAAKAFILEAKDSPEALPKLEKAEQILREAISDEQRTLKLEKPKATAIAYYNLGAVYFSQGNYARQENLRKQEYQEALTYYLIANELYEGQNASLINNIGLTYLVLEQYEDALARFNEALKIARELGDYAKIYSNLLITYRKLGLQYLPQARKTLDEALIRLQSDPCGNADTLCKNQGILEYLEYSVSNQKASLDKALKTLNQALKLFPNGRHRKDVLFYLALGYDTDYAISRNSSSKTLSCNYWKEYNNLNVNSVLFREEARDVEMQQSQQKLGC